MFNIQHQQIQIDIGFDQGYWKVERKLNKNQSSIWIIKLLLKFIKQRHIILYLSRQVMSMETYQYNQTTMQWIIMVLFKYQSYETNWYGYQWNLWVYTYLLKQVVKIEFYFDHHVVNIHRGNFVGQSYLTNKLIVSIN